MYQKAILVGRFTKDIELKMLAGSGNAMAKTSIAVDRPYSKGKDKTADFFNVIIWGKTAEFASQYTAKGKLVLLEGRFQTGSYENKEGTTVKTFDFVADKVQPIEWASKGSSDFSDMKPIDTGDIPF